MAGLDRDVQAGMLLGVETAGVDLLITTQEEDFI